MGFNEYLKELNENIKELPNSYRYTYLIFGLFSIIFSIIAYSMFMTSADNMRYFFSTLAQSQAALGGIIISLTLVAIQMASQSYSLKVMDLFLKNKSFWVLFSSYAISIIYNTIILITIPKTDITTNLALFSILGVGLAVFTTLYTFSYLRETMTILKPEKIYEKMIESISSEEIKHNTDSDENIYECFKDIKMDTLKALTTLVNKLIELKEYDAAKNCIELTSGKSFEKLYDKYFKENSNFFKKYVSNLENMSYLYSQDPSIPFSVITSISKITIYDISKNMILYKPNPHTASSIPFNPIENLQSIAFNYSTIDDTEKSQIIFYILKKIENIQSVLFEKLQNCTDPKKSKLYLEYILVGIRCFRRIYFKTGVMKNIPLFGNYLESGHWTIEELEMASEVRKYIKSKKCNPDYLKIIIQELMDFVWVEFKNLDLRWPGTEVYILFFLNSIVSIINDLDEKEYYEQLFLILEKISNVYVEKDSTYQTLKSYLNDLLNIENQIPDGRKEILEKFKNTEKIRAFMNLVMISPTTNTPTIRQELIKNSILFNNSSNVENIIIYSKTLAEHPLKMLNDCLNEIENLPENYFVNNKVFEKYSENLEKIKEIILEEIEKKK
ncbi:DUF2254 family protein [Methanococcus maripaludis]|uniref:DED domain-containing protein n=1 Tax=Methanococcus maripaludis (strain DSM 14266 / JCM 13030 / NBRC 101832 / S2 / LL) TaxID=267377 RepID=Q6LZZ8_METMP|nr:DUF2254 family protein [Methanococcus maripaludis]CAF30031.1 hypothetical protein MMP0475 [Methanococcus maripaludis S2]